MPGPSRFAFSFVPLSALLLATSIAASAAAAPTSVDRVKTAVDPHRRIALTESRAGWASVANDRGAVDADLALTHLSLTLKRSPERQRAFEQLLRDQQDPSSPHYHRWLSPTELGEMYGASDHDVTAMTDWLRTQGLAVDGVSKSRTRIRFSGNAAAVSAAFSTSLRYYETSQGTRISNASTPEVPAALADAIRAVSGLHTIRYTSSRRATAPRTSPRGAVLQPAASNCGSDSGACDYAVFPADFDVIYNLASSHHQAVPIDGSGQHIAVVGRARVYAPDIENFQNLSGLPTKQPTVIVPPSGTDPGPPASTCSDTGTPSCSDPSDAVSDQGEATLDVQRAGSVAPGATIDLIVSGTANSVDGVNIAVDYAIDHDPVPAKILSISFTSCEADNGRDVAESLDDFFSQAASEGISVFVASGDAGVAGCASLDSVPSPSEPLSTNVLCSSGSVTCVGGTQFADASNPDAYWSRTNDDSFLSALSYIPEGAWNEPLDRDGHPQLAATGGGVSAFIATPPWQTGAGVPGNQGRYTPDVSLHASLSDGYFSCLAAQGASCAVENGSFTFISAAGTSASAPSMAGIAAMLNQLTGSAQANLNPRLYALAANPANGVFHDVTPSSSGVSGCTLAEPSMCNNSTPGPNGISGGLQGYAVTNGYDRATGLGSVDVGNLLAAWTGNGGGIQLNQVGLTGSWYNPITSGQGIVMQLSDHFGGNSGVGLLFGGWFTYDTSAAGGLRWYSIQGNVDSLSSLATMAIYRSEGGNFDAPPSVGAEQVGIATFSFSDCSHGSMTYAFSDGSGRDGTIPLTRLGANVACSQNGAAQSVHPSYYLSGAWYNAATSGQGFFFDINPVQQSLFGAWYTYAVNAQPGPAGQRWFTLQGGYTPGDDSFEDIGIYASSGGVFDDPAHVTTTPVGSADIHFENCGTATLDYTFTAGANAGQHGSIALGRVTAASGDCGL